MEETPKRAAGIAKLIAALLALYFGMAELGRSGSYLDALGEIALFVVIFSLGAASAERVA